MYNIYIYVSTHAAATSANQQLVITCCLLLFQTGWKQKRSMCSQWGLGFPNIPNSGIVNPCYNPMSEALETVRCSKEGGEPPLPALDLPSDLSKPRRLQSP